MYKVWEEIKIKEGMRYLSDESVLKWFRLARPGWYITPDEFAVQEFEAGLVVIMLASLIDSSGAVRDRVMKSELYTSEDLEDDVDLADDIFTLVSVELLNRAGFTVEEAERLGRGYKNEQGGGENLPEKGKTEVKPDAAEKKKTIEKLIQYVMNEKGLSANVRNADDYCMMFLGKKYSDLSPGEIEALHEKLKTED